MNTLYIELERLTAAERRDLLLDLLTETDQSVLEDAA